MDISGYNARARAEKGVFVALNDPYTDKVISKNTGFYVRGLAARSVQSKLSEMRREAKLAAESSNEDEDEMQAFMEKLHENLIDSAMKYIIRADDEMKNGDDLVGSDPDKIRAVLDMTFPEMRVVKDQDGNRVMTKAKDEDGNPIEVPKFDFVNKTFSQQIIEAAEDGTRFFAKTPKG